MALVDKKETPKILYKLWKDDYVHMEVEHLPFLCITRTHIWQCSDYLVFSYDVFNFVFCATKCSFIAITFSGIFNMSRKAHYL